MSKYKIEISMKNLSFFEANKIYDLIIDNVEPEQKDNCIVTIIDPVNGRHLITEHLGVNPNGEVCENCLGYSCEKCPKYKHNEVEINESHAE